MLCAPGNFKIMTKRKIIQLNRKWHRYLGVVLGIQFLLWTLGGLYFSWTDIDEIRGDNLKEQQPFLYKSDSLVSPSVFLTTHFTSKDSILSLELTTVLENPTYRVVYYSEQQKKAKLFNAITGTLEAPLTKEEAILTAKTGLNVDAELSQVEYLVEAGKHHEYRGRPIPVYAVTFSEPANTTIYVSKDYGNIQTFRSNQWRAFDFLWMLHTMDYEGRDNFNNILLRAFALFGLFSILSGFSLYIFTSRIFNKKRIK